MIFQEPMTVNPLHSIGRQIA
jgi:hypothetical protein